jgi:hypothetical protein
MTEFDKVYEQAVNDVLPFESWERLSGESAAAFSSFTTLKS